MSPKLIRENLRLLEAAGGYGVFAICQVSTLTEKDVITILFSSYTNNTFSLTVTSEDWTALFVKAKPMLEEYCARRRLSGAAA